MNRLLPSPIAVIASTETLCGSLFKKAPAVRNKHYEPAALYDPYTGEQLETLEGYNFRIGNHAFPSIAQWRALEALHGVPPRVFADDAIKKQSELAAHGGKNPLREGDPRIPELQKAHRAAKSGSPQTDDARA